MKNKYDFSGWATRNNLKCSDGRTITKDAFKHNDGQKVPLVWNHRHDDSMNILGHALLENREEGVYAYCTFNDTEAGRNAKMLVEHGDISALSIYANRLKQNGTNVSHGEIREVSLVLTGANPGAFIDTVISHGETMDEEAIIYNGLDISISHSKDKKEATDETIQDIYNTFSEKQKDVVCAMIGMALEENQNEKGEEMMKHNVFEHDVTKEENSLTHGDGVSIIELAKTKSVGSLQEAVSVFIEQDENLQHGFEDVETLFPDYELANPGAPELVARDYGWVDSVIKKAHKSPYSRIRTRQADITDLTVRGKGFKKGKQKSAVGNTKLISRTTDPQTVYVKDALHRDDIIDITDFDVVEYQYGIMKSSLNEEIAIACMIGDGREDGDADKIEETHIRPIWKDDELFTIHSDVDIETTRKEIQGTNTSASFGDNYIYAEAIVTASLYSREQYKGSGSLDFYCTPHLLNVMLLARDMNGRRIYDSKADLAKALNVNTIHTAEQFEGKTRTTADGTTKKLLGLFVNMKDYQIGSTKGGEIAKFRQFDIDFNQEKMLIETRLSGALIRVKSAIALEETITTSEETVG